MKTALLLLFLLISPLADAQSDTAYYSRPVTVWADSARVCQENRLLHAQNERLMGRTARRWSLLLLLIITYVALK